MATEVTSTIRSSGGDYTALSSWEAGEQADLVSADEISSAECYDDWAAGLDDQLTIAGWTTDATRHIKIYTPAAERHDGTPGTGFRLTPVGLDFVPIITVTSNSGGKGLVIEGLELDGSSSTKMYGLRFSTLSGNASDPFVFEKNAIYGCNRAAFDLEGYGNNWRVRNNLVITADDTAAIGAYIIRMQSPCYFSNNTVVVRGGKGFLFDSDASNRTWTLQNNLVYRESGSLACFPSEPASGNIDDLDYNASSDASLSSYTGANNRSSQTFTFEDAANDDYHLASGDAGAKGYGVNLYSDFTTDIDGDEWPSSGAWDIGADHYLSGGAVNLAVADCTHSHAADNIALVQANTLTVADSLHSHAVDNIVLSQAISLIVASALHNHLSDNIDLLQASILSVQESLHGHTADNITLSTGDTLIVQSAQHSHSADAVALVQANTLAIDGALHSMVSDNIDLTQASVLSVAGSLHSHTADNITLDFSTTLVVDGAIHAHSADSPALVQANVLQVLEALHAHTVDGSIGLITDSTLIVSDVLHQVVSDNIGLILASAFNVPDCRIIALQARDRIIALQARDRTIVIVAESCIYPRH